MVFKDKTKLDVGGQKYGLGRKNNKDARELVSKLDIADGKQHTTQESYSKSSKLLLCHGPLEC